MHSFPNLEPVWCSMFCYNYCFLTCIHISQEAGKVRSGIPISWRTFQFVVIHIVKSFSQVNEAEVDAFWNSLDFSMIQQMLAIWFLVPLPFLNQLKHLRISVHVPLKPSLDNFEHYFASMWDECNCVTVWTFFAVAFLWDWNENWHFPVLWPLLSFLVYWV